MAANQTKKIDEDIGQVEFPDLDASRGSMKVVGGTDNVGDEALRQRFIRFTQENPHLTTKRLEADNQIGVSKTALDAYLKGTYFISGGPGGKSVNPKNSKVEPRIREYLDSVEGSESNDGQKTSFAQTVLWQQFQYAANTAIEENIIAIAYGSPGDGKTVSMRQYMTKKVTTRPIHILCSPNITARHFLRRICKELKLKNYGTVPDLEDRIVERLLKSKRALFVDQANFLNENSIGSICYIWDQTGIPIVLAGTYKLYDLFMTLRDTEDIRGQMASRIGLAVPLLGVSDVEAKTVIVEALGANATAEVVAEVFNHVATKRMVDRDEMHLASFRNLSFLLPRLRKLIAKRSKEIEAGTVAVADLVPMAASKLLLDY